MAYKVQNTRGRMVKDEKMTPAELKNAIENKLFSRGVADPKKATSEQLYHAVVYVMKDIITKNRNHFKKRIAASDSKKVCYLCMEFLIGRSLRNNAMNLGIYDSLTTVLEERLMTSMPAKPIPVSETAVSDVLRLVLWIHWPLSITRRAAIRFAMRTDFSVSALWTASRWNFPTVGRRTAAHG